MTVIELEDKISEARDRAKGLAAILWAFQDASSHPSKEALGLLGDCVDDLSEGLRSVGEDMKSRRAKGPTP